MIFTSSAQYSSVYNEIPDWRKISKSRWLAANCGWLKIPAFIHNCFVVPGCVGVKLVDNPKLCGFGGSNFSIKALYTITIYLLYHKLTDENNTILS